MTPPTERDERREAVARERYEEYRSGFLSGASLPGDPPHCPPDWDGLHELVRQAWIDGDRTTRFLDIAGVAAPLGEQGSTAAVREGSAARCYDCGLRYDDPGFADLVVSHDMWNRFISPTRDEGGLLCPTCMVRAAVKAGLTEVPAEFKSGPFACDRRTGELDRRQSSQQRRHLDTPPHAQPNERAESSGAWPTIHPHVEGGYVWTDCQTCGADVAVDEDGCCMTCGEDATHYGERAGSSEMEEPVAWRIGRIGFNTFFVTERDVAEAYDELAGYCVTPLYTRPSRPAAPREECTCVGGSWCAIHGDCTCSDRERAGIEPHADDCPLHSPEGRTHG